MNDNPNVRAGLSQKNKTELRELCKALSFPLSGHETKPQLTRKIKAEREPPRQADSRGGRCYRVAAAKQVRVARETVTVNVSESDEHRDGSCTVKQRSWTQRRNWQTRNICGRWFNNGRHSEVQCNLKMMNEQQRTMLRMSENNSSWTRLIS